MNPGIHAAAPRLSIAVIGLGNIGSQVVPLLAGVPGVAQVILIDPDRYSASNLGNQRIAASDVDQLKVKVQRRKLRGLAADIAIDIYPCRVEAVPPARLRNCVNLACVDCRSARQSINQIACRLGRPWIDAGLDRSGSVRARVYLPEASDCLECNWGDSDYALLEQRLPCNAAAPVALPTAAPMELGAIAAGLQVALLRRLLSEGPAAGSPALTNQQWFFDLPSGHGWIGRYAGKNPHCRFDHARWPLSPLTRSARDITLGETFALAGTEKDTATLSVDGQTIVRRVRCPQCRTVKNVGGRVSARMKPAACRRCGGAMMPAAIDASDSLCRKDISAAWLDRPLAAFGLVDGDIITLQTGDATVHYEVGFSGSAEAL
jgi:molybdopterin/thiamine biosynthesis adenylyltransferase